jgi:hypothetical protein
MITRKISKLAYYDNVHDFGQLDINNNFLSHVKQFYINEFGNDLEDKKDLENYVIKEFFYQNISDKSTKLSDLNRLIINNFNIVFNVKFNKNNINELISDFNKVRLRHVLYFLIKTKNSSILNFILDFINIKSIIKEKEYEKITELIIQNIDNKKIKNRSYPTAFFDDMASGLNKNYLNFKVLNIDKQSVDQANVEGIEKYFENFKTGKTNRQLFVNNPNQTLGFKILESDTIEVLGCKYYFKDNNIFCEYKDIQLIILKNSVGRLRQKKYYKEDNETENGIYQKVKQFNDYLKNKNYNLNIQNYIDHLAKLSNTNPSYKYIQIILINIEDLKDEISIEKVSEFLENINSIIISKRKNTSKMTTEKNLIETSLGKEYNGPFNSSVNNISFNISDMYLFHKYGITSNDVELTEKQQFEYFYLKNNMNEIIKFDGLYNLYINDNYRKDNMTFPIFVNLMFGAKRFGDWIQVNLSKKHYFMLQTKDKLCKVYSYIIGAPVTIDFNNETYIFNYDVPMNLTMKDFYKITEDKHFEQLEDKDKIIFRGIQDYMVKANRNYFVKYIKYKLKYTQLKKSN